MSRSYLEETGYIGPSFLDMSPLRRQHTPLLGDDKELPPVPKFTKLTAFPYSTSPPTLNYFKRISLFIFLELGFIIISAISLAKPIVIGLPPRLDEAKGAFTVLFIIWQTIAVLPLQHIVLCTFSHEWFLRWTQPQSPLRHPDHVDQISTLTSGASSRFRYLVRGESSHGFKLALATSVALLGLVKLGPGAVGVATVRRTRQVPVIMGKLTLTSQAPEDSKSLILQRAQTIAGLEQFGSSSYRFDVQSNYIVGWTLDDHRDYGAQLTYPSDLVQFGHTCRWEAPALSEANSTLSGGGVEWTLGRQSTQGFVDGGLTPPTIFPFIFTNLLLGIFPAVPTSDTPLSAYLFYGSNSTFRSTNSSRYAFDIGNVPSLVNPTRVPNPQLPIELNAPLLSLLICDPHLRITGGQVQVLQNGSLSIESKGHSPIGNIPQSAANFLFSQGLIAATQLVDMTTQHLPLFANQFSSRIFLQLDSTNPTPTYMPLDLNSIARNINIFLLSASKAFSDGYSPTAGGSSTNAFASMSVIGTFQEEVIALTASETFLIITIILSLLTVILTTALYINVPETLQLFHLKNILQCLEGSARIPWVFIPTQLDSLAEIFAQIQGTGPNSLIASFGGTASFSNLQGPSYGLFLIIFAH